MYRALPSVVNDVAPPLPGFIEDALDDVTNQDQFEVVLPTGINPGSVSAQLVFTPMGLPASGSDVVANFGQGNDHIQLQLKSDGILEWKVEVAGAATLVASSVAVTLDTEVEVSINISDGVITAYESDAQIATDTSFVPSAALDNDIVQMRSGADTAGMSLRRIGLGPGALTPKQMRRIA